MRVCDCIIDNDKSIIKIEKLLFWAISDHVLYPLPRSKDK